MRGFILVFMLMSVALGQNDHRPFRAYCNIVCDDDTKSEISSYIRRELRELNDVCIDSNCYGSTKVFLTIVALKTETIFGEHNGYALSIVSQVDFSENLLEAVFFDTYTQLDSLTLETMLSPFYAFMPSMKHTISHRIRVCDRNDLKEVCQKVVAHFDSEVLEPIRNSDQRDD